MDTEDTPHYLHPITFYHLYSITYKWVTIVSLVGEDTDPTSWWREYKGPIIREKPVGREILQWPSMCNEFRRYDLPCYITAFQILPLKKLCPVLSLKIFYSFLSFSKPFKAYLKSLLHCDLSCGFLWEPLSWGLLWDLLISQPLLVVQWDSLIPHKYLL